MYTITIQHSPAYVALVLWRRGKPLTGITRTKGSSRNHGR